MAYSRKQYPIIFVIILTVVNILAAIAARSEASAENNQAEGIPVLLELFASGLDNPVDITNAGPDDRRLFVSENAGLIKIVQEDGIVISKPYLDITGRVASDGEEGFLYFPLGDGGGRGDENNNAQNLETILGKILRIDVDSIEGSKTPDCSGLGSGNYGIPSTNPFIDGPGGHCDEIWAYGLRNPWRSSFDSLTGDFYIGDVGQNKREEINFQPAGSKGGENYGWRCFEGKYPFNTDGCGSIDSYTFPIFDYAHAENPCSGSVTGGYVYRGRRYPIWNGRYFLADFCKGTFWDLERSDDKWEPTEHLSLKQPGYSAFGQDSEGEIYLANMFNGSIYLLELPPENISYFPSVSK